MTRILFRDRLASELASVEAILADMPEDDFVGRTGFEARKEELETELSQLAKAPSTLANVAILFNGNPVNGSRSIRTNFASKMLELYQDLVAKRIANSETGGLAQRGPIPSKQAAALNITALAHGSFGFVLEEDDPESPQLINSSLKEAVEQVSEIFKRFASESETEFTSAINEIDPRVFGSIKAFFKVLHDDEATVRIVEGSNDSRFDAQAIDRAYQRCEEANVDEEAITVEGTLIGVLPVKRRFELKIGETEVIEGKVGPVFSRDYLERIEKDEQFIGRVWEAKLLKRNIDRPGQQIKSSYVLLDLGHPGGRAP